MTYKLIFTILQDESENRKPIKVSGCARCGEDHDVYFFKFSENPIEIPDIPTFTHWGMCPNLNEPILMRMYEVEQK